MLTLSCQYVVLGITEVVHAVTWKLLWDIIQFNDTITLEVNP